VLGRLLQLWVLFFKAEDYQSNRVANGISSNRVIPRMYYSIRTEKLWKLSVKLRSSQEPATCTHTTCSEQPSDELPIEPSTLLAN
jgi:hypothetical protein